MRVSRTFRRQASMDEAQNAGPRGMDWAEVDDDALEVMAWISCRTSSQSPPWVKTLGCPRGQVDCAGGRVESGGHQFTPRTMAKR